MAMNKFKKIAQLRTVNHDTGELFIDETISEVNIPQSKEPAYIKLYLSDVGRLVGLQYRTMAVLLELLKRTDYQNRIVVSRGIKIELCVLLGVVKKNGEIAPNVIDQHLNKLIQTGLIFKHGVGLYVANPYLFGKGKWDDIKEITMQVSYSKDGAMIMTDIKKSKLSR
jgi:hypothetical protein